MSGVGRATDPDLLPTGTAHDERGRHGADKSRQPGEQSRRHQAGSRVVEGDVGDRMPTAVVVDRRTDPGPYGQASAGWHLVRVDAHDPGLDDLDRAVGLGERAGLAAGDVGQLEGYGQDDLGFVDRYQASWRDSSSTIASPSRTNDRS